MAKFNIGYIYIIVNKAWTEWCKVGRTTTEITKRMTAYQTCSPFRDYECVFSIKSTTLSEDEAKIYEKLKELEVECRHEWYKKDVGTLERVISDIVIK